MTLSSARGQWTSPSWALSLTRQGWNAFDELQQNLNDDLLAFLRGQGIAVTGIAAMLTSPKGDREGVDPTGIDPSH